MVKIELNSNIAALGEEVFTTEMLQRLKNDTSIRRIKPTRVILPITRRQAKRCYKLDPIAISIFKERIVIVD